MKKIIIALFLLCLIFSTNIALADDSEWDSLSDLECLVQKVIRTNEKMTLQEFTQNFHICLDTDPKFYADKFMYFCYAIAQYYYKPITPEELFEEFKRENPYVDLNDMDKVYASLFSLLDKYSYYLPPEKNEAFWNPMGAKGIGVTLVYDETGEAYGKKGTFVEGVSRGSSAEEAGIMPGDRLVNLQGISVDTLPFGAVQAMLSSFDDSTATMYLELERNTEEEQFIYWCTLERRDTVFREISFHLYPEKKAFLISLDRFSNRETAKELISRMKELKKMGYKRCILDLRDNGGGDVEVAASIIGAFMTEARPVFYLGREGKKDYHTAMTTGKGVEWKELYVLVNENTASSAEITAQSLKQHAGAVIVGTKTVGKAVAQTAATIIDDSTYAITTFVAYDVYGETYNEKGLTPRLIVENEVVTFDFPKNLEWFNHTNYIHAVEGAENEVVLALEKRLELLGIMPSLSVDGVWDSITTDCVKIFQMAEKLDITGKLSYEFVTLMTAEINIMKQAPVVVDHQLSCVLSRMY